MQGAMVHSSRRQCCCSYPIQITYAIDALLESSCILASTLPSTSSSRILHTFAISASTPASTFTPSPLWALGTVLGVGGGLFRLKAYHELGKFFTFQLALLKDHRLVTTGPFALVRHPSYAGMTAVFWGCALAACAPGSWTRVMLVDLALRGGFTSGPAWLPWARGLGVVVLAIQVAANVGLVARTGVEDEMLKREFGKEWQAWAKQTPYKLVPGIY
jgi:protein-S-isoprenylcysteine O-methyltransferase Ste14